MPRKTFSAGEVLAAADVNTYLSNEATLATGTANYTLLTADRYKTFRFTNTAAATVTVGTATAFVAGERVDILRDGTATLTITRDGTATTLLGAGSTATSYTISTQYTAATILCVDTNTYRVIGNIASA